MWEEYRLFLYNFKLLIYNSHVGDKHKIPKNEEKVQLQGLVPHVHQVRAGGRRRRREDVTGGAYVFPEV